MIDLWSNMTDWLDILSDLTVPSIHRLFERLESPVFRDEFHRFRSERFAGWMRAISQTQLFCCQLKPIDRNVTGNQLYKEEAKEIKEEKGRKRKKKKEFTGTEFLFLFLFLFLLLLLFYRYYYFISFVFLCVKSRAGSDPSKWSIRAGSVRSLVSASESARWPPTLSAPSTEPFLLQCSSNSSFQIDSMLCNKATSRYCSEFDIFFSRLIVWFLHWFDLEMRGGGTCAHFKWCRSENSANFIAQPESIEVLQPTGGRLVINYSSTISEPTEERNIFFLFF